MYAFAYIYARTARRRLLRRLIERAVVNIAIPMILLDDAAAKAAEAMRQFGDAMAEAEKREFDGIVGDFDTP